VSGDEPTVVSFDRVEDAVDAAIRATRPPLALPPGLYTDVSFDDYHRDPAAGISLSSTVAKEILRSPRHAWRKHPKLGAKPEKMPTRAMTAGTILHLMVLGKGPIVRVIDAADFRTKKAREDKAAALAAGHAPVLAEDHDAILQTATELSRRLLDRGIDLSRMQTEITLIWEEEGVLCRLRADAWDPETATVYDLKFLASAEPEEDMPRYMMNQGIDIQGSHYVAGFEHHAPDFAGRVGFKLVVVEKETDEILVASRAGTMRQLGDYKRGVALARWKECLAANKWPGYNGDKEASIAAPDWAMRALEEGLVGGSKDVPF
jgi:hypothetical protein